MAKARPINPAPVKSVHRKLQNYVSALPVSTLVLRIGGARLTGGCDQRPRQREATEFKLDRFADSFISSSYVRVRERVSF